MRPSSVPDNRFRKARMKAGMTQQAMSELLGIPKRTIGDWETGMRTPPDWVERLLMEKLERIAQERMNTEN